MSEESYHHKYDKLRERVKDLRADLLEQEYEIEVLKKEVERLTLIMHNCPECKQSFPLPILCTILDKTI